MSKIDVYNQEAKVVKSMELADEVFGIEPNQQAIYDSRIAAGEDASILEKANAELCAMAKEQSTKTLNKVLQEVSVHMKNGYNRADN